MSVETTPAERAEELAEELGETITEMPEYQEFLEAKEAVEQDEAVQEQITEFEQIREEFMMARQAGEATNDDLRELQSTQQELHEMPTMSTFLEAKSTVEMKLQELNHVVSEPLAVDFGETAGGCCQD
ncbi:MAG: YlbF family regulator [Natronomonas sp.]